jgi:hypothetical protein
VVAKAAAVAAAATATAVATARASIIRVDAMVSIIRAVADIVIKI